MSNNLKAIDTAIRREQRINDGFVYNYELIMHKSKAEEAVRYSMSAELLREDGAVITRAQTGAVFLSEEKAIRFFEKAKDNLATPKNLPYLLEDSIVID